MMSGVVISDSRSISEKLHKQFEPEKTFSTEWSKRCENPSPKGQRESKHGLCQIFWARLRETFGCFLPQWLRKVAGLFLKSGLAQPWQDQAESAAMGEGTHLLSACK